MTLAGLAGVQISFHLPAPPDVEALNRRVVFDASGILVGTVLGYRLLLDFIRPEGVATVRMKTELALAHGIQATLVPTLSFRTGRFEVLPAVKEANMYATLALVYSGDSPEVE